MASRVPIYPPGLIVDPAMKRASYAADSFKDGVLKNQSDSADYPAGGGAVASVKIWRSPTGAGESV